MKTLKFLLAITIACCALTACVQEEEMIMPLEVESYALTTPVVEVGPIEILRDYIEVSDDFASLDIDVATAKKLGVPPENFSNFLSNIEEANADIAEFRNKYPNLQVEWVFGKDEEISYDADNEMFVSEMASNAQPRNIPTGRVQAYGSGWYNSDPIFLDGRFNCLKCHAWAAEPTSLFEAFSYFNGEAYMRITVLNPQNPVADFNLPISDNNTSGYVSFKANAYYGELIFVGHYQQIVGI